jgi:hypothetical protein
MDPADAAKHFRSWAQEKVIRIREEDLGAGIFKRLRKLGFDRGVRAHGHEEGSFYLVMQSPEGRGASTRAGGLGFEAEIQAGHLLESRKYKG